MESPKNVAEMDQWTKRELNRWAKLRTGKGWTVTDMSRTARVGLTWLCYVDKRRRYALMDLILAWRKED